MPKAIGGYAELKQSDFPEGEPVLIWRVPRGAWWCEKSSGYTESVLNAGFYTREEAFEIAFCKRGSLHGAEGSNGYSDNFAVPLRLALSRTCWTVETLRLLQERVNHLIEHAETEAQREAPECPGTGRPVGSSPRCPVCGVFLKVADGTAPPHRVKG